MESVWPAVAIVASDRAGTPRATAVAIHQDGYLVTNVHAVTGSATWVKLGDRVLAAEVVALDEGEDLALLRVPRRGMPAAKWGDSDELKAGQRVVAVGVPLGLSLAAQEGIVSSPVVRVDERPRILLDLAVNRGNSG
ncbi:MAG TPA: trypsin-like peptidase domain-containing protein [Bacillota bacterium]|nr:trypsin-like peptidase domain-containing protein [Bacillota bacterium]